MPLVVTDFCITSPSIIAHGRLSKPVQPILARSFPDHGAHIGVFSATDALAVLLLLGSHVYPIFRHRIWVAHPRVRDNHVLPVHVPRSVVHALRADLLT